MFGEARDDAVGLWCSEDFDVWCVRDAVSHESGDVVSALGVAEPELVGEERVELGGITALVRSSQQRLSAVDRANEVTVYD